MQSINDKYHICKKIGEGGYGRVFAGRRKCDERQCAIKMLLKGREHVNSPHLELEMMKNVVSNKVPEVFEAIGNRFIVMEFCKGVPLTENLSSLGFKKYNQSKTIIHQLTQGVSTIHQAGIIHNDLKPDNILIEPSNLKIIDFGLAEYVSSPERHYGGNIYYGAPEKATPHRYSELVDVFSLEIVILEILLGKFGENQWVEDFQNHKFPSTIMAIGPQWKNTILKCIASEEKRISAAALELLVDEI